MGDLLCSARSTCHEDREQAIEGYFHCIFIIKNRNNVMMHTKSPPPHSPHFYHLK